MEEVAHFLDYLTKLLYGTHLSLAFSGVTVKAHKKDYTSLLLLVLFLQNFCYFVFSEEFSIQIYPFLIHLPIVLFLYRKMKVPLLHAIFSLILAFQLLSCRSWLGMMLGFFTGNTQMSVDFATSILSFPLALALGHYVAPPIARLKTEPSIMIFLSIAPISYYICAYSFNIYAIFSLDNTAYLLRFMEAWFVVAFTIYAVFSLHIFELKRKHEVERAVLLNMQCHAEEALQQLHNQYDLEQLQRHDMRHHGQYILSALPENADPKLKDYIESVLISPEEDKTLFSNNETLNLLLGFYEKQTDKQGVSFEISVEATDYTGFSTMDLSRLLSNGLENAMKSVIELPQEERKISLKIKSKGQTLTIDMRNTYGTVPVFLGDLPYTEEEKHGYGTKSMMKICEKYHGITRFCVIEDEFCFQTVLRNKVMAESGT